MKWILLYEVAISLFTLILIAGCISQPIPSSIPLTTSTEENYSSFSSYDDAIAILNHGDGLAMAHRPYTIHSIIGENVTPEGRATLWILAIKNETMFYFIYSDNSFSTMNWTEDNPYPAINLQKIISPLELFNKHHFFIQDLFSGENKGISEIELSNGIYYLRGYKNNNQWEYKFDAVDGHQIY